MVSSGGFIKFELVDLWLSVLDDEEVVVVVVTFVVVEVAEVVLAVADAAEMEDELIELGDTTFCFLAGLGSTCEIEFDIEFEIEFEIEFDIDFEIEFDIDFEIIAWESVVGLTVNGVTFGEFEDDEEEVAVMDELEDVVVCFCFLPARISSLPVSLYSNFWQEVQLYMVIFLTDPFLVIGLPQQMSEVASSSRLRLVAILIGEFNFFSGDFLRLRD